MERQVIFSQRSQVSGDFKSPPTFSPRGYEVELLRSEYPFCVSVSALIDYLYCPKYSYLRHVEGLKPALTARCVKGIIKHELVKYVLLKQFSLVSKVSCEMNVREMAEFLFDGLLSGLEVVKLKFRMMLIPEGFEWGEMVIDLVDLLWSISFHWARELKVFSDFCGFEGEALARYFVPWRDFEVCFQACEIGISGGRVDVIEDGLPVEIKTGVSPKFGIFMHHRLQLVCYSLLMEYASGRDVDFATVFYMNGFDRRGFVVDNDLRCWALGVRDEAFRVFSMDEPPKKSICNRRCSLRRHCIALK